MVLNRCRTSCLSSYVRSGPDFTIKFAHISKTEAYIIVYQEIPRGYPEEIPKYIIWKGTNLCLPREKMNQSYTIQYNSSTIYGSINQPYKQGKAFVREPVHVSKKNLIIGVNYSTHTEIEKCQAYTIQQQTTTLLIISKLVNLMKINTLSEFILYVPDRLLTYYDRPWRTK